MKNELMLGSLFDGSGGFPLGGMLAGITPLWASEIEPFAVRVTTKRLPQIKHYKSCISMEMSTRCAILRRLKGLMVLFCQAAKALCRVILLPSSALWP